MNYSSTTLQNEREGNDAFNKKENAKKFRNDKGIREVYGAEADRLVSVARNAKKVRGRVVLLKCSFLIFIYTAIGWCIFQPIFGWTFVDSLYFAMVTVTTVGYGDLTPDDEPWQQVFVGAYAFLGVAFVAIILRTLASRFVRYSKKAAMRLRLEALKESRIMVEIALGEESQSYALGREPKQARSSERKFSESISMSIQAKEAALLTKAVSGVSWVQKHYHRLKRMHGALVDIGVICIQIVSMWCVGALILMYAEGFTFTQSIYCSIITSLSVGYGDYYPVTQRGRLAFSFYIPISVTVVMGCVGQLLEMYKGVNTVRCVKIAPMTKIFDLDLDGDGKVSMSEYVLFMLTETKDVDIKVIEGLKEQFRAMDSDKSGELTKSDFPKSLEVQTTTTVFYGTEVASVEWKVVPKDPSLIVPDTLQISEQYAKKRESPIHATNMEEPLSPSILVQKEDPKPPAVTKNPALMDFASSNTVGTGSERQRAYVPPLRNGADVSKLYDLDAEKKEGIAVASERIWV
jgi:hypothetical protein